MNEQVISLLGQFGFSEQEIEVYLVVLALDSPSVTEIARKIGKARNAIYFHIGNLKQEGLLSETRKGKRRHYVALPPTQLAERFLNIASEFQSLAPHISVASSEERVAPVIDIIESRKACLNIYQEISHLPAGSLLRVLEGKQALRHELGLLTQSEWGFFFTTIIQRKIKTRAIFTTECKNIPVKGLSNENRSLLTQREWEMKLIPEKVLAAQQLMFIYGKKVAFLFPDASLVITMEHPGITNILASSFDALYNLAGKNITW